jgi:hypothetical protein
MRFLTANALWWLLLSLPIIFFYLLKLKRKRLVVPTVFLWQRALQEVEANAPFRRLRKNLLLLLQLAALTGLVFAIARPLITVEGLANGNTVIIIDATASMNARDEDGDSRLNRAKQIAHELVGGMSGDDRAAIIESSGRVTVRSSFTTDRAALHSAIDDVVETDTSGDLADALRLAEQIAKSESDAGIVIIGDGGGNASPAEIDPTLSLRFVRVGTRAQNLGLTRMNSRSAEGGTQRELFASIANFSDSDREVTLQLRIDGALVDARNVKIAAADRSGAVFESLPTASGLAELRFDTDDDLSADNVAYTYLEEFRKPRVAVLSQNQFLIQAFAVNDEVDARRIVSLSDVNLEEFDCAVIEGPSESLPSLEGKALLAINPPDVPGYWQVSGTQEQPAISEVDRAHPINSYLNYADLHIEKSRTRQTVSWLKPIVSSDSQGLIWAGENASSRIVLVGFGLPDSDLPLKVEFPILITNCVAWLTGRENVESERIARGGQPVVLRSSAPEITVTNPTGDSEPVSMMNGNGVYSATNRVGLYSVTDEAPFAVNLLSESESDTTPRESIRTRSGEVSSGGNAHRSEKEVWWWIALAGIAFLSFEWIVYHRRIA